VVNSARVGVAKPEAAIYRHAAEVAGVDVSRCLFVDDLEENAIGARAVGMTGLHYREARDLAKVLVAPNRGN
jgi:putative hydrolase of the HAD superfamily